MNPSHNLNTSYKNACLGQSLGEYALIGGLILTLSVPAMLLLGGNLNASFGNMFGNYTPKQSSPLGITALPSQKATASSPIPGSSFSKAPAGFYKGTGYYTVMVDPQTGKPALVPATSSQIDVAGSNGNFNILGTTILADKIAQLANVQSDPELKNYFGEMAKLSYYMAVAEGELDDIDGFNFENSVYTNGDALQDIYQYHHRLLSMMQNPPSQANPQELQQVLPLATEVFNIGHNYVNNLSHFIDSKGRVTTSFETNTRNGSGTGQPGGVLTHATTLISSGIVGNHNAENVISYGAVKEAAANLLAKNNIKSQPVKTTLTDAQIIDTHSVARQADD